MDVWLSLTTRFPDFPLILREATHCPDWTAAARLRARVRGLGMTKADQAVALGLLASVIDG